MPLSNTSKLRNLRWSVFGVLLIGSFAAWLIVFRPPPSQNFSAAHKAEIQRIANTVCAAASEKPCELAWGGKSKWFGTLYPPAAGRAKVGLDHIRVALPSPSWQESPETNGVVFKSKEYEVFYSSASGAVSITAAAGAGAQ